MYPTVSTNSAVQAKYEELRKAGESHHIADICAHQAAPRGGTDATFMQGRPTGRDCFEDTEVGDIYFNKALKKAKEAGVNVHGKTYSHSLAEEMGDPKAWISGKSDVKSVCEERGMSCEGAVNVKGQQHSKTMEE